MIHLSIPNPSNTLIIGVTGHRDLLPQDWQIQFDAGGKPVAGGYLVPFVEAKLSAIKDNNSGKDFVLLSGMAEGADLLVTLVAHQLGIPFIAVLADTQAAFLKTIQYVPLNDNPAEVARKEHKEQERKLCEWLLPKAQSIVVCDNGPDYRGVGVTIARYTDELIALWNGTDTGKVGGTWAVVQMARTGRDTMGHPLAMFRKKRETPFRLHHLLTPRQDSPYPIPRFFNATSIQSLLPLGTSYSWVQVSDAPKPEPRHSWRAWFIEHRTILLKPILPFVLFCLTMFFGTWGIIEYDEFVTDYQNLKKGKLAYPQFATTYNHIFQEHKPVQDSLRKFVYKDYHHLSGWQAFYKALHFETVFPPPFDAEASDVSWPYLWGKYIGMIFFLYAGLLIALRLMGDTARHWWLQLRARFGMRFALVLGLNEFTFATLTSLRHKRNRVVALEPKHRSPYLTESEKKGVTVFEANPEDPSQLLSVRFNRAAEVFLLGPNDTQNLHIAQQMERLLIEKGHTDTHSDWYIQVQDDSKRRFLNRFTHHLPNVHIFPFNLHEIMARRLLVQYPIDRFYRNPAANVSHVFIIGFGEMGQQLARHCLRLNHFSGKRQIALTIFTDNPDEKRKHWNETYPFVKANDIPASTQPTQDSFSQHPLMQELATENFGHVSVYFHALPHTDLDFLRDEFPVYTAMKAGQIVTVYACMHDEFKSAAYLSMLLEQLNAQHTLQVEKRESPTDIQVFCYWNAADAEETALMEQRFNEMAPHIPILCFGNLRYECSATALRDRALDSMAQLTALYYDEVIEFENRDCAKETKPEQQHRYDQWQNAGTYAAVIRKRAAATWVTRREVHKESNRLFADHAFIKLREVWEQMSPQERQQPGDITQLTANYLRNWVKDAADNDVMSHLEHRRWCAEKMLDGWVPLVMEEEKLKEYARFWKNDRAFKTLATSQKRHLDLVPGRILKQELNREHNKDTHFIAGIPVLVEILQKTDE